MVSSFANRDGDIFEAKPKMKTRYRVAAPRERLTSTPDAQLGQAHQ